MKKFILRMLGRIANTSACPPLVWRAGLFVYIFIIALLLSPIQLFCWTTPIDISDTPGVSNNADITCDKYGRIHVVWNDNSTGNYEILYRYFNGSYWESIANLSNDSTHSHQPQIACDTFGYPHTVWTDWGTGYTSGELRYAYYDGANWQEQINLSDTFSTLGGKGDIGVDTSNNIHVVWSDGIPNVEEIYHSIHDGISWSVPPNKVSIEEGSLSPCIVAGGMQVHAVWMDRGGAASDSMEIYYSKYDTSWSEPINISNMVGSSRYPKMCCSPQDNPYIIWQEWEGGFYVYYTFCNGDSWATPWKISRGVNPVISVDLHNNIHVVFDWYVLYYTFYNGDSWSDTLKIWDSPVNALLPAMVTDGEWLHLVWTEAIDGETAQIYYSKHEISGVEEKPDDRYQNLDVRLEVYPNPFSKTTVIRYSADGGQRSAVSLKIYDMAGRLVKTFPITQSLNNSITWHAKGIPAGIYFVKFTAGTFTQTQKLILMR